MDMGRAFDGMGMDGNGIRMGYGNGRRFITVHDKLSYVRILCAIAVLSDFLCLGLVQTTERSRPSLRLLDLGLRYPS